MTLRLDLRRVWQRFIAAGIFARRDKAVQPVPGPQAPVKRLPATHGDAALSLLDMTAVNSMAFAARSERCSREGLHPEMVQFAVAFKKACKARGFPMYLHCGMRTDAEQDALFKRGVSKARAGQSPHNHGMAVDFVHLTRSWDLTNKEWAVLGALGKEVARKCNVKIRWGGDWKFYDPAHWELLGWTDRVRNGE